MATTEAQAGAGTGETHLRYRPHLDGLRTVAVYLVVAFHAGLRRLSGGFIGVDIFFVLSGFLVTSILLRDLATSGRLNRRRFYSRRVRRILPAALATLVLTALAFFVIATPADVFEAMGGFRSACLFVANWYFIHQSTDYFAANVNSNPVLHFWSLAVEEQFYLLWPLVLGGLFVLSRRAGRGRWWVLRIAVAVLALASAIEALHIGNTNLDRAYYGTDTRAYQLLAGAFLALTPQLLRLAPAARRVIRALAMPSLLALVVFATSTFSMSPITRGLFVAVFASVLIVALENASAGRRETIPVDSPDDLSGPGVVRHVLVALAGHRAAHVSAAHQPGSTLRDHGRPRRASRSSATTRSNGPCARRVRSSGTGVRSSRSGSRRASSSGSCSCPRCSAAGTGPSALPERSTGRTPGSTGGRPTPTSRGCPIAWMRPSRNARW